MDSTLPGASGLPEFYHIPYGRHAVRLARHIPWFKYTLYQQLVDMSSLQWAHQPEMHAPSPKSQRSDLDSPSAMKSKGALRPTGSLQRRPSANTRYMNMLLELDAVPRFHNMLASFFTWILLAGFVIFPGTFTSIQQLDLDDPSRSDAERWILSRVKNVPLLVIASLCCAIGAAGMIWLWYRWHKNFIWLVNRIFLPGTLHGLAGEISTLVNIFSQQRGRFSTTAIITTIVTGACTLVCGVLVLFYSSWKLERVKRAHHRTLGTEVQWCGDEHEGMMERAKKRGNELEPEPGTTV
ncbi:hypothetical protein RSOLAG22IIIB_13904 [Rhizoctonia solani]|uniref:Uncharacterized protein n=1 Tax=Rhizoctonia solani TaxID=456999 RepID=A0A0K6FSP0_9AGAM|nr:hypothetical protein RSOLAG22IIIB_13904 [Rhizoctonia solani]